jgi:hypothetical protein
MTGGGYSTNNFSTGSEDEDEDGIVWYSDRNAISMDNNETGNVSSRSSKASRSRNSSGNESEFEAYIADIDVGSVADITTTRSSVGANANANTNSNAYGANAKAGASAGAANTGMNTGASGIFGTGVDVGVFPAGATYDISDAYAGVDSNFQAKFGLNADLNATVDSFDENEERDNDSLWRVGLPETGAEKSATKSNFFFRSQGVNKRNVGMSTSMITSPPRFNSKAGSGNISPANSIKSYRNSNSIIGNDGTPRNNNISPRTSPTPTTTLQKAPAVLKIRSVTKQYTTSSIGVMVLSDVSVDLLRDNVTLLLGGYVLIID